MVQERDDSDASFRRAGADRNADVRLSDKSPNIKDTLSLRTDMPCYDVSHLYPSPLDALQGDTDSSNGIASQAAVIPGTKLPTPGTLMMLSDHCAVAACLKLRRP